MKILRWLRRRKKTIQTAAPGREDVTVAETPGDIGDGKRVIESQQGG